MYNKKMKRILSILKMFIDEATMNDFDLVTEVTGTVYL